jgi:hypothetical protein
VLGFIFNILVQDKAADDRRRGYPHAMAARHLANEAQRESVDALLDACCRALRPGGTLLPAQGAPLWVLPSLADYDRYAPLGGAEGQRSFAEAREIVTSAYRDFSPRMAEIAERFFAERWIDAELRPGKRGGAFSASTVPAVHPYVMLNYTGNLRDVMTVAHELGHGVHQSLASAQGLFEQDTPLTTAETASVFGEMLVFRRLMREEKDPRVRLALLCGKLEDAFATVFRQVAMTRFEQALHAARREAGELPLERVNELWMAANRPMFGDSVELSDDYAWWWLYIPHFVHSPFYCYAYAFGELLVLALLRRYDEEGSAFVPRYLALLEAGGSDSPERLLAAIGLDIADPDFWRGGLDLLEGAARAGRSARRAAVARGHLTPQGSRRVISRCPRPGSQRRPWPSCRPRPNSPSPRHRSSTCPPWPSRSHRLVAGSLGAVLGLVAGGLRAVLGLVGSRFGVAFRLVGSRLRFGLMPLGSALQPLLRIFGRLRIGVGVGVCLALLSALVVIGERRERHRDQRKHHHRNQSRDSLHRILLDGPDSGGKPAIQPRSPRYGAGGRGRPAGAGAAESAKCAGNSLFQSAGTGSRSGFRRRRGWPRPHLQRPGQAPGNFLG